MIDRWRKGARTRGDCGPSPVPWLSDAVWRGWNEGDPHAREEKVPNKPISDATPTAVTEDDRRRAGRGNVAPDAPVPPTGTLESHAALLDSTPGLGYFAVVRWPVCCERLSTLISDGITLDIAELERDVGSLDHALTEVHLPAGTSDRERFVSEAGWRPTLAAMRVRRFGDDGVAFFQCRACGRVYGAYHHP